MVLLPVIERELRSAARQPFTHYLRVLGVLALLGVFLFYGSQGKTGSGVGGELFSDFHAALFWSIWVLVPLASADCISRERREGTLPLLFMTLLKPRDIVYAKGLTHGLRAFTLWLAAVPVLTICFVAGGVSWDEIVLSVLVNFSSICLTLAAGLAASAMSRSWTRALSFAATLTVAFFVGLIGFLDYIVAFACFGRGSVIYISSMNLPDLFALATNWGGAWQQFPAFMGVARGSFVWAFVFVSLCSLLWLLLVIRFSAWSVKQLWQERPPSPGVEWLKEQLFRPVFFQNALRRWLRWELQRNPIGWLERRSWSGRLVVWGWFAVVACIYSSVLSNINLYQRAFHALQSVIATLLAGSIAVSAANSFRRERESGVLELLLVAPLREWQIISGRVRGLFGQFVPAVVLLCSIWLCLATFLTTTSEFKAVAGWVVTFATLPIIGLYFSLARANFIAALLWTLGIQIIAPAALERAAAFLLRGTASVRNPDELTWAELLLPAFCQVLVALVLGWQLHRNLTERRFALPGQAN